jgi:hydroxypyruvate isomerase
VTSTDAENRASCTWSFNHVSQQDWPVRNKIKCFEQQLSNTRGMEGYTHRRIAKRKRNNTKFSAGMLKTENKERESIQFFQDHCAKLECKVVALKEIIRKVRVKQEQRRKKCIAFAMGHHKRLGSDSMMARLEPEVLRMILEQV